MPQGQKIATCCYCGTRAVLRFDRARHELVCSACGAPLHNMKFMPQPAGNRPESPRQSRSQPARQPARNPRPYAAAYEAHPKRPPKPRKRRKTIFRRVIEELWDEVEDIFD